MNADPETTRIVRSWLDEGVTELPDRVLDAVLDQVPSTQQRRAGWPAWRTPTMNRIVGLGLGAAAVVVALFVGVQLFGPPGGGIGSEPIPTVTVEPTAVPTPSPSVASGLPEGPHLLIERPDSGASITVTIAAPDWSGNPSEGFIEKSPTGAAGPTGAGVIGFPDGEYYVYGDPCAWSSTTPDTPATTVDEVMAVLARQASREASAPEEITVDGYAGKKIILDMSYEAADFDACDEADGDGTFGLFAVTPDGDPSRRSWDPGQIEEVWAVDVDGVVFVTIGLYYPDTPQHVIDEVRALLASASFELP